jgi:hypothetical protein
MSKLILHGMYRFQYVTEDRSNAKLLESQMWLIGEDEKNYIFSARPAAGTQYAPKVLIRGDLEKIDDDSGVFIGRVVRKNRTPHYVRSEHCSLRS